MKKGTAFVLAGFDLVLLALVLVVSGALTGGCGASASDSSAGPSASPNASHPPASAKLPMDTGKS